MKHRKLVFAIFSVTLLAFGSWFVILQSIDPFTTDWFSRLMFFLFFLTWIWGALTLIMFLWRRRKIGSNTGKILACCVRQGLIIAFGLVGLLALQTMNVLNILSASVYVIALILIEFYFRTRNPHYA